MSENMEVVTFTASTIFDRKVRNPGDTVTVSEGEAENLRRIGVVAEKGADTETVTDSGNYEENDYVNHDKPETEAPDTDEPDEVISEPETEPETANEMPSALPSIAYGEMSKKELKAELDKRNILLTGKENKTKMLELLEGE